MHGPAVGLTPLPDTLSSKQKWCWRPNGGGAEPSAPEGAGGTAEGQPEPKEPKGGGGNTNTHSEREGEKGRKAGEMEGDGVRRSWGEQDAPRHCIAAPERGPERLRGAQRSPSSPARTPAAAAPSASSACTGSFAAGGAGGGHTLGPPTPPGQGVNGEGCSTARTPLLTAWPRNHAEMRIWLLRICWYCFLQRQPRNVAWMRVANSATRCWRRFSRSKSCRWSRAGRLREGLGGLRAGLTPCPPPPPSQNPQAHTHSLW